MSFTKNILPALVALTAAASYALHDTARAELRPVEQAMEKLRNPPSSN